MPNPVLYLRALKGAPLALLLALRLAGEATITGLALVTGYDRKSVARGLAALQRMELASHDHRAQPWRLTPEAIAAADGLLTPQDPAAAAERNKLQPRTTEPPASDGAVECAGSVPQPGNVAIDPPPTVAALQIATPGLEPPPSGDNKGHPAPCRSLGLLLADYLAASLATLRRQLDICRDHQWLARQPAAEAAQLHKVLVDRIVPLLPYLPAGP